MKSKKVIRFISYILHNSNTEYLNKLKKSNTFYYYRNGGR